MGRPAEVGPDYQRRKFDDEIDQLWADGGDGRIWLRGQPGLGKSYTARRIMQEAAADQSEGGTQLLIWVDSADPEGVRGALSEAVEGMPHLALGAPRDDPRRVEKQADALVEALETSSWSWLIVFDNADAEALLDERLIPGGANPKGRLLVTTLSRDRRIARYGRIVKATLFNPDEAEGYLRAQVDPGSGRAAGIARSSAADIARLAEAVAHHPLALSIATATITANHMTVEEWVAEFENTASMDDAADEVDAGGYPHLIGTTWKVALEKASRGLPPGVVERTAAVAAVQDPDGHPTWLWDREPVTAWVAGDEVLERRHGRPVAVQRLIDNGIVDLTGDNWKEGRITIHQLAARAVRELFPSSELTELGGILTAEWFRAAASAPRHMIGGNIAALVSAVELSERDLTAANALRGFARVLNAAKDLPEPTGLEWWSNWLADLQVKSEAQESVIDHLGPDSKSFAARQAMLIAHAHRRLGGKKQSKRATRRAVELYQQVLREVDLDDRQRASSLAGLADALEELERRDEAMSHRRAAIPIHERLVRATGDPGMAFDHVSALADLWKKLERPAEAESVFVRYYDTFEGLGQTPATEASDAFSVASKLEDLADVQLSIGRTEDAIHSLTLAATTFGGNGWASRASEVNESAVQLLIGLGDWDASEELLARIVRLEGRPEDADLADDLVRLASVRMRTASSDDPMEGLARAVAIYRAIKPETRREEVAEQTDAELGAARHLGLLGFIEQKAGRFSGAQHIFSRQLQIQQQLANASSGDHEDDLADTYQNLGITHARQDQHREALECFGSEVRIRQTVAEMRGDNDRGAQEDLAKALARLAITNLTAHNNDEAIKSRNLEIAVRRKLATADTAGRVASKELANALEQLGIALARQDRRDEALHAYNEALSIVRTLAAGESQDLESQLDVASTLELLAEFHRSHSAPREAETAWNEAAHILTHVLELDPQARDARNDLAHVHYFHAWLCISEDRLADAKDLLDRSLRGFQTLVAGDDNDDGTRQLLAGTHFALAQLHEKLGEPEMQRAHLTKCAAITETTATRNPGDLAAQAFAAVARAGLAEALREQDREVEAIDLLSGAADVLQFLLEMRFVWQGGDIAELLRESLTQLAEWLRIDGRTDEARVVDSRLEELDRTHPKLDDADGDLE